MKATRVLVKKDDAAFITCPFCCKTKKVSVAQFKNKRQRDLRIKCCCDNMFCTCLEYRQHPRKFVKLLGQSINLSQHRKIQNIIITNISLGGFGFSFFDRHRIRKDDRMQVSFVLDDCNSTPVKFQATVRTANPKYIGCEFKTTESMNPSFGFYLLS